MRPCLFLPGDGSRVFVGVVQPHLTKCYSFRMSHGHQYVAFMDTRVFLGKVGVAPKRSPHHVFSQQTLPQGLLHHDGWVTEICNTALKFGRKAAVVKSPKAAKCPTEAKFSIEHVYVAVSVNKTNLIIQVGVTGPHVFFPQWKSFFRSATMSKRVGRIMCARANIWLPACGCGVILWHISMWI